MGDLRSQVVFLGGAVVGLLLTEPGGLPPRVTRDVDVAIEVGPSLLDLHTLDRRLLQKGFANDMAGPVCRYLHGTITIDVIPVNSEFVAGVNPWYPHALSTAWDHLLPSGKTIRVIDPVCFLGTKMAAFRSPNRENHDDIFLSRDFTDMVRVIDGRSEIVAEVEAARADLREYLAREFCSIQEEIYFDEAIRDNVEPGREEIARDRVRRIAHA